MANAPCESMQKKQSFSADTAVAIISRWSRRRVDPAKSLHESLVREPAEGGAEPGREPHRDGDPGCVRDPADDGVLHRALEPLFVTCHWPSPPPNDPCVASIIRDRDGCSAPFLSPRAASPVTAPTPVAARPPWTGRTLTLGGTPYPLVLPNIRDPRLHVASVIITIHVLGQVGLHFHVSVPQILAAILACWVMEVALTFRSTRMFVWPASAMLTGSGVALILRVVGTPADQPWYTGDWWVFAGVAAFALATKYVIKYRGSHVFNPSNVGLVVAFIVLGSSRVEPLDFWWGPLNGWLLLAYAVILVGGILITRRLKLLALAATFWLALASGLGVLAASGHCMTANWAFAPVCGVDYWRVIVTSPELLIFLFFMITDPKTSPSGRVGRVVFGLLVAITSTLLMAPQTDEFGTKVGLLTGLVLMCAARPLIDRLVPGAEVGCRPRAGVRRRAAARRDRRARTGRGGVRAGGDRDRRRRCRDRRRGRPARGASWRRSRPRRSSARRRRSIRRRFRRSPWATTSSRSTTRSTGPGWRRSWSRSARTWRSRTRRC